MAKFAYDQNADGGLLALVEKGIEELIMLGTEIETNDYSQAQDKKLEFMSADLQSYCFSVHSTHIQSQSSV